MVRRSLRDATAAVHQRLHESAPFARIAQKRLGLVEYTALVAKLASFHFAVGPHLQLDSERRDLLARDLESLGAPPPVPIAWTPPANAGAMLGWTYVVEGSSLGGKVIYRQLDYLFDDTCGGRRFFRGGASDGDRWRALCSRIEVEGREPAARRDMIAGAADAFALFEQLIARVAP